MPKPGKTIAVFAILNDKDLNGIVELIRPYVDQWYISEVKSPRAMEVNRVEQAIGEFGQSFEIKSFDTVEQAYLQAQNDAHKGDRILVFGSIFTVSEVLASEK